mgnify:CR=1 FL=1
MLLEKNFTSRMIYILLFLFSLNIFNQSSLILAAVFIFIVICNRGKLYIPANDKVFFVLAIFAAAYFAFSAQNGLNAGISAIGCPMAYYIGLRVQNEQMEISQAEKQLKSVTILLVAGMTCHAVVNFLYELVRFGGINSGAVHYDFFSMGAKTSATGAATYLTLFAGVIFYLIMESNSVKKWIAGILLIVITFAYDMILGGRTFFALAGVSFALSMIVYIWGQKDNIKKMKAIGKLILIALVLAVAAIAVYIKYQDAITKMFESTYLFHRISYANMSQSQDLLSFFKSSDRGNIREQYIALMFDYPWGGRKALSKVGFYAHELWLDIFDSAGIIPFVLIWIVTIQITFSNLKYILNKKVPIENRVLITGITASVTVQFFFEPALTGCRALLFSYLLICGIIRSQLSQY